MGHLRIFGSQAFLRVPDQQRKKLHSKAKQMILVGYCEDSKAYRLINPEEYSGKVHKGRDVDFIEIPETSCQRIDNNKIQEETEMNPLCEQEDEIQERGLSESEEEETS